MKGEKIMRQSRKITTKRENDFEALQGGKLAESTVLRQFAEVRKKRLAELGEDTAIQREAGKHFSQLAPSGNSESPHDANAISGLRRITERLARRKLPVPGKLRDLPGVWGNYTLKFTPPYTALGTSVVGQISAVTGNPTISATGNDALGQLSCSVDTNFDKPSGGTASNLMGIHFKPLFDQATARISFNSEFSFSWYVNSIRNKIASSRAQGLIQLFQFDTSFVQPSLRRGAFIGWNIVAQNELKFNYITQTGPTWSLEAPVSSAHFYFLVFSLDCSASGSGWPGSLAGARTIVTVPSITVTITADPVFQA
jgi:hypothetical protein